MTGRGLGDALGGLVALGAMLAAATASAMLGDRPPTVALVALGASGVAWLAGLVAWLGLAVREVARRWPR